MPFRYNLNNQGAQVAFVALNDSKDKLARFLKHGGRVTPSAKSAFGQEGDKQYMWAVFGSPGVEVAAREGFADKYPWELKRARLFCELNGHKRKVELRQQLLDLADGDDDGLGRVRELMEDRTPVARVTRTGTARDKVLAFFAEHPGWHTTAQVAMPLDLPYRTVNAVLRGEGFERSKSRRRSVVRENGKRGTAWAYKPAPPIPA